MAWGPGGYFKKTGERSAATAAWSIFANHPDFPTLRPMRQRGRKSAALVTTLPAVDGEPPRLKPPPHLNDDERSLFDELVGACDPRHFVESDLPLLASYVQATLIARDAAHAPSKIVLWEKAVRMQATLATRLRLSPQSRIDPKTVGRRQEFQGPLPWEI